MSYWMAACWVSCLSVASPLQYCELSKACRRVFICNACHFFTPGVLKAWIDPMPDGTLPNSTIRSAILKHLDELPIDCALEDRKAQLKRSGLGRTIMFLAKVSGMSICWNSERAACVHLLIRRSTRVAPSH